MRRSGPGICIPSQENLLKQPLYTDKELPPIPPSFLESESAKPNGKGQVKPWRPVSHSLPVFLILIVISICLIVALQLLLLRAEREGGILFSPDVTSFSAAQTFVYLYLPVVIVVLFGLGWTWIDLDTKRLEPYYSLACPSGATGKRSICLDYTSDFAPIVPIKAMTLRHWTVGLCASGLLIISWGITPFVGSIFNLGTTSITTQVDVTTVGTLLSVDRQDELIGGGIFNDAYAQVFLNQTIGPFTTDELALVPFRTHDNVTVPPKDGTLSATTEAYRTNLICSVIQPREPTSAERKCGNTTVLDSGQGCVVPNPTRESTDSSGLTGISSYQGWYGMFDQGLGGQGCPCPQSFSNAFLAHFWLNDTGSGHHTYLFCKTQYERLSVRASIRLADDTVISWDPISAPTALSQAEFNTSRFDQLLSLAVPIMYFPDLGPEDGFSLGTNDINQVFMDGGWEARLHQLRPRFGTSYDLSQYVFFMGMGPLQAFSDPGALATAFQSIHRRLFNLAIMSVITGGDLAETTRSGEHTTTAGAVLVSKVFVLIAQSCLGISCLIALLMYGFTRRRTTRLLSDPNSILNLATLMDSDLPNLFDMEYQISSQRRPARLLEHRFGFEQTHLNGKRPTIQLKTTRSATTASQEPASSAKDTYRPLELRTCINIIFALFLTGMITALTIIKHKIDAADGLPLDEPGFVRNLVLNYIPTLLGSLLEALWVVINRAFCVLTPFEILSKGQASATASIAASFTDLPPQLTIFRALGGRHVTLSVVCVVAIVANVVSVALSGLFIVRRINSRSLQNYSLEAYIGGGNGRNNLDIAYPLGNNLTDDAALPPWVSPHHFFLPLSRPSSARRTGRFRARTAGVSLVPNCQAARNATFNLKGRTGPAQEYQQIGPLPSVSTVKQFDGGAVTCRSIFSSTGYYDGSKIQIDPRVVVSAAHSTKIGVETFSIPTGLGFNASYPFYEADSCLNHYTIAWLRAGTLENGTGKSPVEESALPNLQTSAVTCDITFAVEEYEIVVDDEGHVLEVNESTAQPLEAEGYFRTGSPLAMHGVGFDALSDTLGLFQTAGGSVSECWHNATLAADWLNYFIKLKTGSYDHVDPRLPPPDPSEMAPIVADILKRTYAIGFSMRRGWLTQPVPASNLTRQGFIEFQEDRLFFATYLYEISTSLLAFNLVVAIMVLFRRPGGFLPRPPTTTAAVGSYLVGSSIIYDLQSGDDAARTLSSSDTKFAFGKYIGTDGLPHVGIDRQAFVTSLGHRTPSQRIRRRIGID